MHSSNPIISMYPNKRNKYNYYSNQSSENINLRPDWLGNINWKLGCQTPMNLEVEIGYKFSYPLCNENTEYIKKYAEFIKPQYNYNNYNKNTNNNTTINTYSNNFNNDNIDNDQTINNDSLYKSTIKIAYKPIFQASTETLQPIIPNTILATDINETVDETVLIKNEEVFTMYNKKKSSRISKPLLINPLTPLTSTKNTTSNTTTDRESNNIKYNGKSYYSYNKNREKIYNKPIYINKYNNNEYSDSENSDNGKSNNKAYSDVEDDNIDD